MQCTNCGHQLQPGMKFCTKCGALNTGNEAAPTHTPPVAPPAQPGVTFGNAPRPSMQGGAMGQPPRKSGCGKVLLVLGIVGVVGLVGIGIAGYFGYKFAQEKIKASEAYTLAIAALKAHPEAQARLGEIKETGFPLGNFTENADGTGAAAYTVSVVGTKARGQYYVVMRREARKWRVVTGKLTLADGDSIDIKTVGEDDATGPDDDNANTPSAAGKIPPGTVSKGLLNSKAVSLPQPPYPAIAKAAKASGAVMIQVVVDETGKVIIANAKSGHPLLRPAAEAAAKEARFTPTLVAGKPVKISGFIMYNFVLQ